MSLPHSGDAPITCVHWDEVVDSLEWQDYCYIIYEDAGEFHAKNGQTMVITLSDADASTVIQHAVDSLPDGGLIYIKKGEYPIATAIDLHSYITIMGAGPRSTIFDPSGNNHVFTVTPTAEWIYHVTIKHIGIADTDSDQTSTAGIFLNNQANDMAFINLEDIYFENTYDGVATASVFDDNENMLHTCTYENLTFELCRHYSVYTNNSIDHRMDNIYISAKAGVTVPTFYYLSPVVRSCGSYITNLTILNNTGGAVANRGVHLYYVNELSFVNTIVDEMNDGIYLDDANRNRFYHTFTLANSQHGIHVTNSAERNVFYNILSQSNTGTGVLDNTVGAHINYFFRIYTLSNGVDTNIKAQSMEQSLEEGVRDYFAYTYFPMKNNAYIRWYDTGNTLRDILALRNDDSVILYLFNDQGESVRGDGTNIVWNIATSDELFLNSAELSPVNVSGLNLGGVDHEWGNAYIADTLYFFTDQGEYAKSDGTDLIFGVAGSDELKLDSSALYPNTASGLDLGKTTNEFEDAYIADRIYLFTDQGESIRSNGTDIVWNINTSDEMKLNSTELAPIANAGLDLGTNALEWNDAYIDGEAYIDGLTIEVSLDVDNIDINATGLGSVTAVVPVTAEGTTEYIALYDGYS